MSFEAYLDNIKTKTGKTPRQLKERAIEVGVLTPDTKASALVAWLKKDFGWVRRSRTRNVTTEK